jgi:hypothetical protein
MNKPNYIEFMRTSTPGPYGIPIKVVEQNENEMLIEIEIDDVIHVFPVKMEDVVSSITSPMEENLCFVDIKPDAMSKLYGKISAVVRSENNQFIL